MSPHTLPAKVAILMATRNGASFLDAQFLSLIGQTHQAIDIWASDDGSTDETPAILDQWRSCWTKGDFGILQGPRKGFAENFRSLLANEAIEADHYAFCDQDDLWEPRKLEAALEWMQSEDDARPLLFCSRTLTISREEAEIGMSPLFRRKPSFRNALVQSLAGGNTMVLNRAARDLLLVASRGTRFVSHDWWAYQMVTGAGGLVHYSSEPHVRYRQHGDNLVGANTSFAARLSRLKFLFDGGFARWNEINLEALQQNRDLLTPDARAALDSFFHARKAGLLRGLPGLRRSGAYRQTARGTLALWVAVAAGLM